MIVVLNMSSNYAAGVFSSTGEASTLSPKISGKNSEKFCPKFSVLQKCTTSPQHFPNVKL